jgi:hypothetical protein
VFDHDTNGVVPSRSFGMGADLPKLTNALSPTERTRTYERECTGIIIVDPRFAD